ncbi:MAG: hypothetical protein AAB403_03800 [Planctomycetota bacterium]
MPETQSVLQDLFAAAFARYLSVRPSGIQMPYGEIRSTLQVTLRSFHPARTLYQNHHPACRSLDAVRSISQDRQCASCPRRNSCTPQIHIELLHDQVPYRLLIAYSSARNFLFFVSRLHGNGVPVENAELLLSVRDRGRWGELLFIRPSAASHP